MSDQTPDYVIKDVLDKLAAEGSADQVAAYLMEHGHTGKRREADACPVSNYVLDVTGERIFIDRHDWVDDDGPVPTPDAIGDFILLFDGGKYPELRS